MAKIKENFSKKQLSIILKEQENRILGRVQIMNRGGYIRLIVQDEFGSNIQTFYSSRGVGALLEQLGLGVTRGNTTNAFGHIHEYEIDNQGNGIAYMAVHPGNAEVKHQHQIVNYEIQEAFSNGWPNTMELYGVDGAPPHNHLLITGSAAESLGTDEGVEISSQQLNIYEDDTGIPYVKPNESFEAIKLAGGKYNLIIDTLRNVLSQIFNISEKESKEKYPFIVRNISPSRKEVKLVFEGDDNINLETLSAKMAQVVGVVDNTRANDSTGNLIQNGVMEDVQLSKIHNINVGGNIIGTDNMGITLNRISDDVGPLDDTDILPGNVTFFGSYEDNGTTEYFWPQRGFTFIHPNGPEFECSPAYGITSGMKGNFSGTYTGESLEAYLIYIGQDTTRFILEIEPNPSPDFVVAYWDGTNWTYDNANGYQPLNVFNPIEQDCIVGRLYRQTQTEPVAHSQSGITSVEKYFVSSLEKFIPSGFQFYEEYDLNKDGTIDYQDVTTLLERGFLAASQEAERMINGAQPFPFRNYQFDYMLSLFSPTGKGGLIPILNYVFDNSNPNQTYLILKLLDPLPVEISRLEKVTIEQKQYETSTEEIKYFRGKEQNIIMRPLPYDPEYVREDDSAQVPTQLQNFNQLTSSFQTSDIYQQILSESYDNLNIDFTNPTKHTFFGSAKRKLENFRNKVGDIEKSYIEVSQSLKVSGSVAVNRRRGELFSKVEQIKNTFTPYEKFLYHDGQFYNSSSAPGTGGDYSYTLPVSKNNFYRNTEDYGFNTVYQITGSGSRHNNRFVSVFDDTYYVQNEPFYNSTGSFYLSFIALGEPSIQEGQKNFTWKNNNLSHIPPLPPETIVTQSLVAPNITGSRWLRYVYVASASFFRPEESNASIGGAGGVNITGSNQSNIEILSGSNVTGSYPMIAGGQYQYLSNTITGSGAGFTGSIMPAGELFNISTLGSAATSSFITDVRITKGNPKDVIPFHYLQSTSSAAFTKWYDGTFSSASLFDDNNVNRLVNNLPAYIKDDIDGNHIQMRKFLDMIGEHFDIIRSYIEGMQTFNKRGYTQDTSAPSNITPTLLKNMGWDANQIFSSSLADYYGSSAQQLETSKTITEAYWNKILNNIVPIYKSKGTLNSINYLLNAFGWPNSILKVREHNAGTELASDFSILTEDSSPMIDGVAAQQNNVNFTTDTVNLYSYLMHNNTSSKLDLDWWTNDAKANTFQLAFKGVGSFQTQSLIEISGSGRKSLTSKTGSFWDVRIVPSGSNTVATHKGYGKIEFRLNFSRTGSGDIAKNALSMSTDYYKLKTSEFWNLAIVRQNENTSIFSGSTGLGTQTYKLMLGKNTGDAITSMQIVSMSVLNTNSGARANENWYSTGSLDTDSGSRLLIGRTFTGSIAEVRAWNTPLSASKFKQHILNKEAIVGNFLTSSRDELIYHYKLNENYISGSSIVIKDSNPTYTKDYSLTLGTVSANGAPLYDLDEIDRTAFTLKADGLEPNENNIIIAPDSSLTYIRDLNPFGSSYLSPHDKLENKRKASSLISIIRSPQDVLNDFFLNHMSDFSISDMMGDPEDVYTDGYGQLNSFFTEIVNDYNIKLEPNKYIRAQKKLFNENIIARIKKLLPARATIDDVGIEFKPSLLEKNKIKGYAIKQERIDYDDTIRIFNDASVNTYDNVIHTPQEIQIVDKDLNRERTAMKFADINILSFTTASAGYGIESPFGGGYVPESIIEISTDTNKSIIQSSGSYQEDFVASFNFFNNDSGSNSHPGVDRNLISTDGEFDNSLYSNNLDRLGTNTITLITTKTFSGSYHPPIEDGSVIHLNEEVSNLFDYNEPNKTWGLTYNDTNFVQYTDFRNSTKTFANDTNLNILNSYHYETRYKFLTIGDTQRVSGSALSISGSVFTPFASASFFRGIENIEIDNTNGIRENGTTVRLIDTNAKGGIKNTNTGSNFGLYLDERYRYPKNHLVMVGKSNTETPSFKNNFFDGVQNGSNPSRDEFVYDNVPEVQDLNSASFYTVTVTGENTITVG